MSRIKAESAHFYHAPELIRDLIATLLQAGGAWTTLLPSCHNPAATWYITYVS